MKARIRHALPMICAGYLAAGAVSAVLIDGNWPLAIFRVFLAVGSASLYQSATPLDRKEGDA